jgi:hypothetical protein
MIEGTSTSTPTTHTHVHVQIHIFIHVLHVFLFQPMHVNTILEYTLTVRCLHLTYTFVRWYCIPYHLYTVYLTSHFSHHISTQQQPTSAHISATVLSMPRRLLPSTGHVSQGSFLTKSHHILHSCSTRLCGTTTKSDLAFHIHVKFK